MTREDTNNKRITECSYSYYNKTQYEIYEENAKGQARPRKCMSFQLPQLLVKQMNSTILAEYPEIEYKTENGLELGELDYESIMHDILAYGRVFIVPTVHDSELILQQVVEGRDEVKYVFDNGRLIYLTYKLTKHKYDSVKKEMVDKNYEYFHYYDAESKEYTYDIKDGDDLIETLTYSNISKMFPYLAEAQSYGLKGKPIYHDARNYINDFDDAFNDGIVDRDLSKPVILLPEFMVKTSMDIDKETGQPVINDEYLGYKQLFRIMPDYGNGENTSMPIEWRGSWVPTNYITYYNYLLHMISQLSGFGEKYFSYDTASGLKTATEIVSEKDDLYKTKKKYDRVLEGIIKHLVYVVYAIYDGKDVDDVDALIKVKFSDSIITDDAKKKELLFQDYNSGALDQITYLEEVGYSEEVIKKVTERMAVDDSYIKPSFDDKYKQLTDQEVEGLNALDILEP